MAVFHNQRLKNTGKNTKLQTKSAMAVFEYQSK